MPIEAAARKAYLLGTQTLNLVCLKLISIAMHLYMVCH
jgi:hypothetical protein